MMKKNPSPFKMNNNPDIATLTSGVMAKIRTPTHNKSMERKNPSDISTADTNTPVLKTQDSVFSMSTMK
jgi:hypothetical protein